MKPSSTGASITTLGILRCDCSQPIISSIYQGGPLLLEKQEAPTNPCEQVRFGHGRRKRSGDRPAGVGPKRRPNRESQEGSRSPSRRERSALARSGECSMPQARSALWISTHKVQQVQLQ